MTLASGTNGDLLVLNGGSSSLKFALFRWSDLAPLKSGAVQQHSDQLELAVLDRGAKQPRTTVKAARSPFSAGSALGEIAAELAAHAETLVAIGHRVVHGGDRYDGPVRLDAVALEQLRALIPLAPLHQPHNLALIDQCAQQFPGALQYAAFDTAFHHSLPELSQLFALPARVRERGVRRYGFHGLSYRSVVRQLQTVIGGALPGRIVVAHLGSGASLCALRDGVSVDTSMGFTALDGLPMATRCGNLDPGVLLHLMGELQMDHEQLTELLYRQSGLLGLSGISGDTRVLLASTDPLAARAVDYFCVHTAQAIAGMATSLGGLDLLVFTGGIGEHQSAIRAGICNRLDWMGIELDAPANSTHQASIHARSSPVEIRIVRSDEQREIALEGRELLAVAQNPDR